VSDSRLVYMTNQIAIYFRTAPHEQAVAATLDHLKKFWEPRMRRQILEHLETHRGEGLSEIALAAVRRLAAEQPAKPAPQRGAGARGADADPAAGTPSP
jgi:formate dehydrogenase subunit delta